MIVYTLSSVAVPPILICLSSMSASKVIVVFADCIKAVAAAPDGYPSTQLFPVQLAMVVQLVSAPPPDQLHWLLMA